jgi:hypothetical protein
VVGGKISPRVDWHLVRANPAAPGAVRIGLGRNPGFGHVAGGNTRSTGSNADRDASAHVGEADLRLVALGPSRGELVAERLAMTIIIRRLTMLALLRPLVDVDPSMD